MKTSLDLPDDLYRKVKSKSALEGRAVREVATALFAAWVDGRVSAYELGAPTPSATDPWPAWLDQWHELTKQISQSDAATGGLVEELQADRR
jgi:hypothetical protein